MRMIITAIALFCSSLLMAATLATAILQAPAHLLANPNVTATQVASLSQGASVSLLKTDAQTGYSLVETTDHVQGWLPSSVLVVSPADLTTPKTHHHLGQMLRAPLALALWKGLIFAIIIFGLGYWMGSRSQKRKRRGHLFL